MLWIKLLALPVVVVLLLLVMLLRSRRYPHLRSPGLWGLSAFLLSFVLGGVAIYENPSSTASLGLLILPLYAAGTAAAVSAACFLFQRKPSRPWHRPLAALLFGLAAFSLAAEVAEYVEQHTANEERKQEARRQQESIRAYSRELDGLLAEKPGEEVTLLTTIAAEQSDRTVLIPVARSRFASPELLSRLVRSEDAGVALSAVRNPGTVAADLEWVFEHSFYPAYFFNALSRHANTPVWVLVEIAAQAHSNYGIPAGLAGNANMPVEEIEKILDARGEVFEKSASRIAEAVLENPRATCRLLEKVAARRDPYPQNDQTIRAKVRSRLSSDCEGAAASD